MERLEEIRKLIGNTPLIVIEYEYKGKRNCVYCKAEWYNLTGSIKDRVAVNIFQRGYESGALLPGQTVIETTSGNMGISLCAVGTYLGHKVKILMPDNMSKERVSLIQGYGGEVQLVSSQEGGFLLCIEKSKTQAAELNGFLARQFENIANEEAHYEGTGGEIIRQMKEIPITAFVAGVGTAGTVVGVGKRLKKQNPQVKVFAVEPESSPTLKVGHKVGSHLIQGISDDFIPKLYDRRIVDDVIDVSSEEAILLARKLSAELGLGVGISSGANLMACIKLRESQDLEGGIVTVFADDNKKYLSTALMSGEEFNAKELSSLKLLKYSVIAQK